MEDLYDAQEAIEARDAIDLFETGYLEHAKRWISEAFDEDAFNIAMETAEKLRASMFQHCVNDADNGEEIQDIADELNGTISELRQRLELVEIITNKLALHNFNS
ncbi:hypothetical protein [Reinekea sp. G2M2-21]|uniref:hypothetical protein n=1 Tax=Reinekea sp. G2M2-21 TaxID=2788942 RepID=UPI0018AACAD4|nr:hypothetical protein [Reinekea sp. G2M2-21]